MADCGPGIAVESAAASGGARLIVGIDEVGRGALAGPVVAAAVALPWWRPGAVTKLAEVRDSKQLTSSKRCAIDITIRSVALGVGVGRVDALTVDVLGVMRATELAMRRAVRALPQGPDHLLVDGRPAAIGSTPQTAVVGGDRSVLSIAAASIVAKVARDAEMVGISRALPAYGFHGHKGYGAPVHLRAICAEGPTVHHRLTWAPLRAGEVRPCRSRMRRIPGLSIGGSGK
jgi:ribonuclease HII